MTERFCERCQRMVPERGIHACVPAAKAKGVASPNQPAEEPQPSPNGQLTRNARWRKAHPEKHRDYMRDYMRKRRAAGVEQ